LKRLKVSQIEMEAWRKQCETRLNTPTSHAAGRLFDSFSALLGIAPEIVTYEGQPAIQLEAAALKHRGSPIGTLPFAKTENAGMLVIDWSEAFRMLAGLRSIEGQQNAWAMAAHQAVADAAVIMVESGLANSKERTVALSGGVFMNRILNDLLIPRLEHLGLQVLIHRQTPPNDGCISFGQAVVAGLNTEH